MRSTATILLASTAAIALVAGCAQPEESQDGANEERPNAQEPPGEPDVNRDEGAVSGAGTPASGPMSAPWSDE